MKLSTMIEEIRPSILWWKFANVTERVLPWRWSQALRHGPFNARQWLVQHFGPVAFRARFSKDPYWVQRRRLAAFTGRPMFERIHWIDPKGTPSPLRLLHPPAFPPPETAGTRRARALAHLAALADAETHGEPS